MRDRGFSLQGLIEDYRAELISPVDEKTQNLVDRFIAPNQAAIVRDMYELRAETDKHLLARLGEAVKPDEGLDGKKGYPVSFCLEITRYMLRLMSREPVPPHMTGLKALHDFVRAGGIVKRIWGALRGTYFQNAIQVGSFYLDVANDTVNPDKDDIEMLPLVESGFRSLDSYFEFAQVGQIYWKYRMIPNRFFPHLAPFYPIISFSKEGVIRLESSNSYMFPMNIEKRFSPAREFVLAGEGADEAAAPYERLLVRVAAMDPRTSRPDSALYFTPNADDATLARNFARREARSAVELERDVEKVLRIDTRLWKVDLRKNGLEHAE